MTMAENSGDDNNNSTKFKDEKGNSIAPWLNGIASFLSKSWEKFEKGAKKTGEKGGEIINDFTTLDVTTAVGDPKVANVDLLFKKDNNYAEMKNSPSGTTTGDIEIAGVTRLDIDGDMTELVNGKKNADSGIMTINGPLAEYHRQNLDVAIESWNRFFRNTVEVTAIIAAIISPNDQRVDLVKALKTNIEPIGKAPQQNKN